MNVSKRTPRITLVQRSLVPKLSAMLPQLAKELGFPVEDIDRELQLFATLCTRVQFESGEIDFEPVTAVDTEAQIAEKFVAYLDSQCITVLDAAWAALAEADRPVEEATGPRLPDPTAKN